MEGSKMSKYKKRKDGRYCTKADIGRNIETGKRQYQMVYGKTIPELERRKSELIHSLDKGFYVTPNKITFKDYSATWFQSKSLGIEMHTKRMYKIILKNYFKSIEDKGFKEITKSDIQTIINENSSKARTCQQIKMTLNQIMESAIDDGLLYKNPCRTITLPKTTKINKRPLSREEDVLSDVTEFSDRECAFVKIIKYAGLRKEETLALTKQDINFKRNIIRINKALVFDNNIPIIKATKSAAGVRDIPMPEKLSIYLKQYLTKLETDNLFYSLGGKKTITEQSYKKMWSSIIKKMNTKAIEMEMNYEIKGLTAHIFRHNYATMLYYAGIKIKEAQKLLGHSSISMTLDIYTHLEDNNDLTTLKLDTFLNGPENR